MKVGILTMHHSYNYGAALQAVALADEIADLGHEVVLVDLRGTYNKLYEDEAHQLIIKRRPPSVLNLHRRRYAEKERRFLEYFAKATPRTALVAHAGDLDRIAKDLDAVVVGSDEVWTLKYGFKAPYFLTFGPADLGRISYAASVGRPTELGTSEAAIAAALSAFDAITVRDRTTQQLVAAVTGTTPPLVLDPVLLRPPAGRSPSDPGAPSQQPTVLVYAEQHLTIRQVHATRRVARELGARIVAVGYPHWFADENVIGAGPLEFVRLVDAATVVVSPLFHGVVFALAHEKQLLILPSAKKRAKVVSLLEQLGLTSLYGNLTFAPIDYDVVRSTLRGLREESVLLLRGALETVEQRRSASGVPTDD